MAYANSSIEMKAHGGDRLGDIIKLYTKHCKDSNIKVLKCMLNTTRFALFYGNANKIHVKLDESMQTAWASKPVNGIEEDNYHFKHTFLGNADAIIYPKKNYIIVNSYTILQRNGNAFGVNFHERINAVYHWFGRTLYAGTKHAITAQPVKELQYTDGSWKALKDWPTKVVKRIPFFKGIKLDLTTLEPLNKCPAKIKAQYDKWLHVNRLSVNARARSRYANRKAMQRLLNFRNGDTNALEMNDAFKLFNVSDRREVIAHFGMDTILASRESKTIDKDTIDGRKYELVKVGIEDVSFPDKIRWCNYLRMINPSTDEIHFEGVPNIVTPTYWNKLKEPFEIQKVTQALAWRDQDDLNSYQKPIVLT